MTIHRSHQIEALRETLRAERLLEQQCWNKLSRATTFTDIMAVWNASTPCSVVSEAALWKAFRAATTQAEFFAVFSPARRDSELAKQAAAALSAFFRPFPSAIDGQLQTADWTRPWLP